MKKWIKYLISIAVVLVVLAIVRTASADTHYIMIDDIISDGYIRQYDMDRRDTEEEIKVLATDKTTRGYFEWDISNITDKAEITQVNFLCHVNAHIGGCCIIGTYLDNRPSEVPIDYQNNSMLYADLENPMMFSTYASSFGNATLSCNQALQNALTNDFFCFGLRAQKSGTDWTAVYLSSKESTYEKPSLWIQYELTLPTPSIVSPEYGSWTTSLTNRLEWSNMSASGENVRYICQYGEDPDNLQYEVDTDETFIDTIDMPFNSTIYWRVQSYENVTAYPKRSVWSEMGMYQIGDLQIPTPLILSPFDGEYFGYFMNETEWTESWGHNVLYEVYYYTDSGYENTIISSNTVSTLNNIHFGDKVWVSIRAIEDISYGRVSNWSDTITFELGQGYVDTPILLTPIDNSFVSNFENVLNWEAVDHPVPVRYIVQYGLNLEHQYDISLTFIVTESFEYTDVVKWRVKCYEDMPNGIEGGWSPTWQFTIHNDTFIPAPVIIYPTGNISEDFVTIDWTDVDALNVKYQYAYDIWYVPDWYTQFIDADSGETYNSFLDLIVDTYYRINFSVRALEQGGFNRISEWTNITFFIEAGVAEVPLLLSPLNNSIIENEREPLVCQAVDDITFYEFEVFNDSALMDLFISSLVTSTSYISSPTNGHGWLYGYSYWWRVRSYDIVNVTYSEWSEVWTFTRTAEDLDTPTLLTPSNGHIFHEKPSGVNIECTSVNGNGVNYRLNLTNNTGTYIIERGNLRTYSVHPDYDEYIYWQYQAYETQAPFRISEWQTLAWFYIDVEPPEDPPEDPPKEPPIPPVTYTYINITKEWILGYWNDNSGYTYGQLSDEQLYLQINGCPSQYDEIYYVSNESIDLTDVDFINISWNGEFQASAGMFIFGISDNQTNNETLVNITHSSTFTDFENLNVTVFSGFYYLKIGGKTTHATLCDNNKLWVDLPEPEPEPPEEPDPPEEDPPADDPPYVPPENPSNGGGGNGGSFPEVPSPPPPYTEPIVNDSNTTQTNETHNESINGTENETQDDVVADEPIVPDDPFEEDDDIFYFTKAEPADDQPEIFQALGLFIIVFVIIAFYLMAKRSNKPKKNKGKEDEHSRVADIVDKL